MAPSGPATRWWEKREPSTPAAFISHASEDRVQAAEVVRTLETAGLRCWIAPRDIPAGDDWAGAIVEGIRQSRLLVVVLSRRSLASREVHREVELASRGKKPILSVRIDREAVLTGPLEFFLATIQWVDATARPMRRQLEGLPRAVAALLDLPAVQDDGAKDRRPPPPPIVGEPDLDSLLKWGRRPSRP